MFESKVSTTIYKRTQNEDSPEWKQKHIVRIGEEKIPFRASMRHLFGKRPVSKPSRQWVENI